MAAAKDKPKALHVLEQFRSRKGAPKGLPPFEFLAYSVLAEGQDPVEAWQGFERLQGAFVDWNELRVARCAEIARALDPMEEADTLADRLRTALHKLFDNCGAMKVEFLCDLKTMDARRQLSKIAPTLPRNVISIILFQMVPGTTIPVSTEGLAEARKRGIVARNGNKQQLQKVLLSELSSIEAGELLQYLEWAGAGVLGGGRKAPAKKSKKTAKKKTGKKK